MSGVRIGWAGSWINPSNIRIGWAGSWITPRRIYVGWGGSWVPAWTAYTAPSIAGPSSYSNNIEVARPAVTVSWTPGWSSAGSSPASFSWTKLSGRANTSINSSSVLNPTFSATGAVLPTKGFPDGTYAYTSDTWRLTLNDGTTVITKDYTITIGRETASIS